MEFAANGQICVVPTDCHGLSQLKTGTFVEKVCGSLFPHYTTLFLSEEHASELCKTPGIVPHGGSILSCHLHYEKVLNRPTLADNRENEPEDIVRLYTGKHETNFVLQGKILGRETKPHPQPPLKPILTSHFREILTCEPISLQTGICNLPAVKPGQTRPNTTRKSRNHFIGSPQQTEKCHLTPFPRFQHWH